ncbi:hypothetical protein DFH08DRAFT_795634 [Mycena albidolilacea]|uniref:Uncharacterized protein n=1 Tax=Mycena albidolilacea TaxID=1033008 RepID=A0AAD7ASY0_9AGAR|nr:hypothetical protein DFH08DRAFT_795634 [Mycena albidolilacea]
MLTKAGTHLASLLALATPSHAHAPAPLLLASLLYAPTRNCATSTPAPALNFHACMHAFPTCLLASTTLSLLKSPSHPLATHSSWPHSNPIEWMNTLHFTSHDLGNDDAMEGVGDGGVNADEVKVDGKIQKPYELATADKIDETYDAQTPRDSQPIQCKDQFCQVHDLKSTSQVKTQIGALKSWDPEIV